VRQAFQVGRRVQRLDFDAFGRVPVERIDLAAGRRLGGRLLPGGQRFGVQKLFIGHGQTLGSIRMRVTLGRRQVSAAPAGGALMAPAFSAIIQN
jgi:hypothetical protein